MKQAYEGEDVPVNVVYTDDQDAATDPDSPPDIVITETDTDTEVVASTAMSSNGTGDYTYVWDTATDFGDPGVYEAEITAEFSTETKISREEIRIV